MSRAWITETRAPEETLGLGRRIGRCAERGDVLALIGELGSGKTHLAKGIAEGLSAAAAREVTSPSFVLCREYLGGRIPFYHLDAYRLHGSADMEAIGSEEFLIGDGLAAVEWADRTPEAMPNDFLEVRLEVTGSRARRLAFTPHGKNAARLLAAIRAAE